YNLADDFVLRQDEDVLDTWFSSALWTFSTLGWPEDREYFERFHPTNVLVTGFDIIFFWVARMIMMTLKFTDEIPFKKVYITGLVRDENGQKMSKSKGNILDPIDLIDGISLEGLIKKRTADMMQPQIKKEIEDHTRRSFPKGIIGYGTDALRFTFYSLASTGRDIKFDIGRMEGFRNFCNKIWNAARYAMMNIESEKVPVSPGSGEYSVADRWIMSRFENTALAVESAIDNYRFDLASQALHEFIWSEYCDWYVELSKPVLWDEKSDPEAAKATRFVLVSVLEKSLRLLHPFMPFITEEVWQKIAPLIGINGDSIMIEPYPQHEPRNIDKKSEEHIEWIKGVIIAIRNIRGEMEISPAKSINVTLRSGSKRDREKLGNYRPYLKKLAKLDSIEWVAEDSESPVAATGLYGELEILVPLAGLINIKTELSRLTKEITKLEKSLELVTSKLNNTKFVENAPKEIVKNEKKKQNQISQALEAFRIKADQLRTL
ncbi:MAG: valine--tRNA ligase, partial [Gammaproteobacteria bacterium]|nr:valine--tRNA ligase [Gammaproteobacteria bacterium]